MDDVDADIARLKFQADLKSAQPLREIVWQQIRNGVDPKYLALRYNLPVETLEAARQEHLRREQAKMTNGKESNGPAGKMR